MPDSEFSVRDTADRLRQSLDTVEWAVGWIPPSYTHEIPEGTSPGEWGAAMNLAHLIVYDEEIANPVLASLAEGGDGVGATKSHLEQWFQPEAEAMAPDPIAALAGRFATAHKRHIEIVESFSDERFNTPVTPLFTRGETLRAPGWIATKTFQHTWEHGNALLRLALFAPRA